MATNNDKIYLSQAQLETLADGGSITGGGVTYTGDENVVYLVPKAPIWTALDSSDIGAVSSGVVVADVFYRNNIAITGGLTGAKAVSVTMSNGATYPAINNGDTQLVIFSGSNFETNNYTVTAVYVSK